MARNDAEHTIFAQLDADSVELDEEELLQLFAKRKANDAKKSKEKDASASTSGPISLLPMRWVIFFSFLKKAKKQNKKALQETKKNLTYLFFF